MKVAYGSDLHFEFGFTKIFKALNEAEGEVLLLAGDIATAKQFASMHKEDSSEDRKLLKQFFVQASEKFQHVFMIMGNHEHYGSEIQKSERKIREALSVYDNVHLLEDEYFVYKDVVFHGATMWTDMASENPVEEFDIRQGMNDFKKIRYHFRGSYRKFSPKTARIFHLKSLNILKDNLENFSDKKFVLLQHHAPSIKSISEKYKYRSKYNAAYYSKYMENEIYSGGFPRLPNILVHGHVHNAANYFMDDMNVLVNPRGYDGHENSVEVFEFKTFEI